jgi:hypothetical protein
MFKWISLEACLMANPKGVKGANAERELADILSSELGVPISRKLGAGRQDDVGDLHGVPHHVVQIANWADTAAAALQKPRAVDQQRENAGTPFGVSAIRFRGGQWRIVLTMEQWLKYVRIISMIPGDFN